MSKYPDTNKLSFFSCPPNEDEDNGDDYCSDIDETEEDDIYESDEVVDDSDESSIISLPPSRSLKSTLEHENVCTTDQEIILKTLTWSIRDRLTVNKVRLVLLYDFVSVLFLLY
jgi:hypothetical protein